MKRNDLLVKDLIKSKLSPGKKDKATVICEYIVYSYYDILDLQLYNGYFKPDIEKYVQPQPSAGGSFSFANAFKCGAAQTTSKKDTFFSKLDPKIKMVFSGIKLLETELKSEKLKSPFIIQKSKNLIRKELGTQTTI